MCRQSVSNFEVLSPKCIVIIGKLGSMNQEQKAAFENFRNNLNNVQILTFDELYQRIADLIKILSETPPEPEQLSEQEEIFEFDGDLDELPF